MTVYRVINETGYKEGEFPDFASAMRTADELNEQHKPAHYRVEQIDIVYHTASPVNWEGPILRKGEG